MKIAFDRITVGDPVYMVHDTEMTYKKVITVRVEKDEIVLSEYSDKTIPRFKDSNGEVLAHFRYRSGTYRNYFFTSEADAIRFCKARMMKGLFAKIESAKRAIESVREFRKDHFELLNHAWTEEQINILERQAS